MANIYSPKEFGKLIGRTTNTLQKWDREGKLKAHRSPTKGLPKNKMFHQDMVYCATKWPWRKHVRTDRGDQIALVEHSQRTEGSCTADVYGTHGSSFGRRRPEAGRT